MCVMYRALRCGACLAETKQQRATRCAVRFSLCASAPARHPLPRRPHPLGQCMRHPSPGAGAPSPGPVEPPSPGTGDGAHPLGRGWPPSPGPGDGPGDGAPLAQGMGPLRVAPCPRGWPGDARPLPRGWPGDAAGTDGTLQEAVCASCHGDRKRARLRSPMGP